MAYITGTASRSVIRRVPALWVIAVGLAALLAMSGCQSQPGASSQAGDAAQSNLPNPPAVTEAQVELAVGDGWAGYRRTAQGVIYSYSYPPGWSGDLAYCPSGGHESQAGYGIPAGCAVTDILVGRKASDLGRFSGDRLTIDGKDAIRSVDAKPRSGMASCIYTVMVYARDSSPLFGFSTSIGRGTDPATQQAITALLDQVAGTLHVEKQP